MKEDTEKLKKEGWIEAQFLVEVLAIKEDIAETSLKQHIEKMEKVKGVFVYEKNFKQPIKIDKPLKNVEVAYSNVVDVKLFVKDIYTLISVIISYGPSSIEILGPHDKKVKMEEIQSLSNLTAGLVHQFAAAGMGGLVIAPK